MRKVHVALLAGAVVVGLGAATGLAVFAPSLTNEKSHELTLQLPGGGTETIAYKGKMAPAVTFHPEPFPTFWPFPNFMTPSFVALDPFGPELNRQLDLLTTPLLRPSLADQPTSAAVLRNLPAETSYSIVSETIRSGACTRFTQITKAAGDAKPKIVSEISGNCGPGSKSPTASEPTQAANAISLRTRPGLLTTQNM